MVGETQSSTGSPAMESRTRAFCPEGQRTDGRRARWRAGTTRQLRSRVECLELGLPPWRSDVRHGCVRQTARRARSRGRPRAPERACATSGSMRTRTVCRALRSRRRCSTSVTSAAARAGRVSCSTSSTNSPTRGRRRSRSSAHELRSPRVQRSTHSQGRLAVRRLGLPRPSHLRRRHRAWSASTSPPAREARAARIRTPNRRSHHRPPA
jgi:hypothetical protein